MSRSIFATLTVLLCAAGCGGQAPSFPDDATRPLAEAVSKHDYAKVQALLATPDGHPKDPAMIGDLLGNNWNDDGKAASAIFQWAVKPTGPEEERAAALAAHAVADCLANCDDKYFHSQGGRLAFAKANPEIAQTLARVLARHVPAMFGDSKADSEFEIFDRQDPYRPDAGLVFVALLGDPRSADITQKAVDDVVDAWIERYARSVREQPTDHDIAALLKAATARGVVRRAQLANHLLEDEHGYFDDIGAQVRTLEALQTNSGRLPGDTSALDQFINQQTGQIDPAKLHGNPSALKEMLTTYWRDNGLEAVRLDFQDAATRYQTVARP